MTDTHDLSARQREILRLIIQDYVGGGRAVGSQALLERHPLHVSSATVRNEMSALERMGLIEQLHTSAGRVPTDRGYRFYVEEFARARALPAQEQIMIRHQFRQVETQLDAWIQLAASVLAGVARNVSVVTTPRVMANRLKHFEVLSLQDRLALLILVTQESSVHQAMLHLQDPLSQEQLSGASDRLNSLLHNATLDDIRIKKGDLGDVDRILAEHILTTLESAVANQHAEVHYQGLEHALEQPEFSGSRMAQDLLELLRGGSLLTELLPQISDQGGVQIFIGTENTSEELQPFGVVVSTYGFDDNVTGLLGILGPRRMPYELSISTVRYMADLMSDLMRDLYSA